jgi:hypothetical protein
MRKVTGHWQHILQMADPNKMDEWYAKNLGLPVKDYRAMFQSREIGIWTCNKKEDIRLSWNNLFV